MLKRKTRAAIIAICVSIILVFAPTVGASKQVIGPGNKSALILCPVSKQFHHSFENVEEIMKQGGYNVTKLTHGQIELKQFRELNKYGLVFMFTHGDTVGGTDSVMSTEIPYEYFTMYLPNKEDFNRGLLIKQGTWLGGYTVGVKSGYIAKYNKGLPDTFVYLNCCLLMHNNSMYDAFTSCGAKATAGFERVAASHEGNEELTSDDKATQGFFEKAILFNADIKSAYDEVYESTGWCNVITEDGKRVVKEYPPPCAGWTLKTAYDSSADAYYLNYKEGELPEIPDVSASEIPGTYYFPYIDPETGDRFGSDWFSINTDGTVHWHEMMEDGTYAVSGSTLTMTFRSGELIEKWSIEPGKIVNQANGIVYTKERPPEH